MHLLSFFLDGPCDQTGQRKVEKRERRQMRSRDKERDLGDSGGLRFQLFPPTQAGESRVQGKL